jgi:hypothetical protein
MSKLRVQFRFAPVPDKWRPYGYTEDPSTWNFPIFVYECLDGAGQHVYIGRTKNPTQRLATHRTSAAWYASVARVVITMTPIMDVGSRLESSLINLHRPLNNVTPRDAARRAWESRWRAAGVPSKYASGEVQL